MIQRMCGNLDLRLDLVFSDKDDSVPNPMNKIIKANIIPGDGSCIIMDAPYSNESDLETDEDYIDDDSDF